jgi:hypothetical protein
MKRLLDRLALSPSLIYLLLLTPAAPLFAQNRILESGFALSADARSEFTMRIPLLSPGRIVVEGSWKVNDANRDAVSLSLVLLRPDGSEAARKDGASPIKLEFHAAETEIDRFINSGKTGWTAKVTNSVDSRRKEIAGKLRITVPASPRTLIDTQFTLLGGGNAQEIPFSIPAPGRIVIEAYWTADIVSVEKPQQPIIMLSVVHPGQNKTYARRRGQSPLRAEHQVTEQELDKGLRWMARVQNDSGDRQAKVRGRLNVIFTPSL